MNISLPKQWKHWCKKAGLRVDSPRYHSWYSRKDYYWTSLRSSTRCWRIDVNGLLCVSCHRDDFDRWANSEVTKYPFPQSEKELCDIVAAWESENAAFLEDYWASESKRIFGE